MLINKQFWFKNNLYGANIYFTINNKLIPNINAGEIVNGRTVYPPRILFSIINNNSIQIE